MTFSKADCLSSYTFGSSNFKCRISACFFRSAVFIEMRVTKFNFLLNSLSASGKKVFSSNRMVPHFLAKDLWDSLSFETKSVALDYTVKYNADYQQNQP